MAKMQKLGACWSGKTKNGDFYLSCILNDATGKIERKIMVFRNAYRDNDRQPDFNIFLSEAKPQEERPQHDFHDTTIQEHGNCPAGLCNGGIACHHTAVQQFQAPDDYVPPTPEQQAILKDVLGEKPRVNPADIPF